MDTWSSQSQLEAQTAISNMLLPFALVLLICFSVVEGTSALQSKKSIENVKSIEVPAGSYERGAFTIVPDEKDGNIFFVGTKNYILKINSSLDVLDSVSNGPLLDSTFCVPFQKECRVTSLRAQENRIILLYRDSSGRSKVISCGTVKQGMCSAHEYSNLKSSKLIGDPRHSANYVASGKTALALAVPGENRFFFAHESDGRPNRFAPPTFSVRKFFTKPDSSDVGHMLESSLDVKADWKNKFPFDFVHSFRTDKYIYVLSNQKYEDDGLNSLTARISRICITHSGPLLESLVERAIVCNSKTNDKEYNHALAAHTVSRSNPTRNIMYIAFDTKEKFILCEFDLDNFDRLDQTCPLRLHAAFSDESYQTYCSLRLGNKSDYCNREGHKPAWAADPLRLSISQEFSQFGLPHSFVVYEVANKTMAFMTFQGNIIKVDISRGEAVFEENPSGFGGRSPLIIRPPAVLSGNGDFVLVAAGERIVRLPTKSCSLYSSCSSCMETLDNLNCTWCGSYCAIADQCPSENISTICSPVIFSFSPKSSVPGVAITFTVTGRELGPGLTNVTLVSPLKTEECNSVTDQQYVVTCKVNRISSTLNGAHVEVQVNGTGSGRTGKYFLRGKATSRDKFYVAIPTVKRIYPPYGPVSSLTKIRVYGSHFDVNHLESARIKGNETSKESFCRADLGPVTKDFFYCIVSPGSFKVNSTGNLYLTYQGLEFSFDVTFTFMDDPVIEDIQPRNLEFDVPIKVTGKNFKSIAKPILRVEDARHLKPPVVVACEVLDDTVILCANSSQLKNFENDYSTEASLSAFLTNDLIDIANQPLNGTGLLYITIESNTSPLRYAIASATILSILLCLTCCVYRYRCCCRTKRNRTPKLEASEKMKKKDNLQFSASPLMAGDSKKQDHESKGDTETCCKFDG